MANSGLVYCSNSTDGYICPEFNEPSVTLTYTSVVNGGLALKHGFTSVRENIGSFRRLIEKFSLFSNRKPSLALFIFSFFLPHFT